MKSGEPIFSAVSDGLPACLSDSQYEWDDEVDAICWVLGCATPLSFTVLSPVKWDDNTAHVRIKVGYVKSV